MKSKKAREFIKVHTINYNFIKISMDDSIYFVNIDNVNKAVELAESEMRERAIKAFIKTCVYEPCSGKCETCIAQEEFITALDNPKN